MSGAASRAVRLRPVLDALRTVSESRAAYVFVKDLDGHYVLASPLVSESAGQEVLGKTDFDLLPADLAAAASQNERAVIESGAPAEAEETRGNQSYRIVMVPLTDARGEPIGLCGIATDITDYAVLVERLFAVQRTEIVGQLASAIAHDFNNLLSVVASHSALALERTDDAGVRSDLEAVQAAVSHGWSLSRQLLHFGNRRPRSRSLPGLSETVVGIKRLLAGTMPADVEIETRLEAGDATVAGDGAQLEQIILNLALNARDAMPEGGKLTIRTALVHGSDVPAEVGRLIRAESTYVCLSVSDTGEGMPSEVLARAVTPFFTTKVPGRGTGLGLATVSGIVKELKGGLAIESRVHEGTTVRVYLPLTIDRTEPNSSGPALLPVVLVVVEDGSLCEEITQALARAGHVALPCADLADAVAVVEGGDVLLDLVVLDADLPGIGAEFTSLLARRMGGARILFLSSDREREHTLDPLLQKPFTSRELVKAVRRALRSGSVGRRFGRSKAGEESTAPDRGLPADR